MIEYLKCECGSTDFYTSDKAKYFLCCKCHNTYDSQGNKMVFEEVKGKTVRLPKVVEHENQER